MAEQTEKKRSFKDTLNLPKTSFAMKANLVQNEPASQKRWQQMKLYQRLRDRAHPRGRYAFHDGPPYANGSIHLGHLLNKCLKDFVVRSKSMAGFDCPYIPGWDCHGLPIEHKVVSELGDKARDMHAMQIRHRCQAYAEKYVKLQAGQMQRLLTVADYDNPYLTMAPLYEAEVLRVFADMVEHGLVYRGLKPVHWSVENRTALADAELEYYDREDTSVYVRFEVTKPTAALAQAIGDRPASLMIWTTTPWTLPANLAVAVHARYDYGVYALGDGFVVLAVDLAKQVIKLGGIEAADPVAIVKGQDLLGTQYKHPFIDRQSPVVAAEYVTLEDGTGLVHTAPGHGVEDYQTCLREGIDIYCPVRGDGTFDDTVPQWLQGKLIWDANGQVVEHLRQSGHLFHDHKFMHSYPHDWRGKSPVIFRATEQWFISVDHAFDGASLRERALDRTKSDVKFIPEWGRNRMRGMLDSRPDWCISRQRAWGLPIPAFYMDGETQPLLTAASVRAVAANFARHGSNHWFTATPQELLAGYDAANDPEAPAWAKAGGTQSPNLVKSGDIFDVWFDSGCSWAAALRRMQGNYPADLYLEGSDQHRGWFQVSLLAGLGSTGQPPFRSVLTHGFMVDKDGRKMSKSLGNTVEVEDLLKEFGADVCRWWVASLNVENDIKVDHSFFALAGEEYRKVRNTIRFLLSNLSDFDPAKDVHQFTDADATSIDAWALGELNGLIADVSRDYEQLHFARVRERIFNFCNDTMSAVYLAAIKDRLYCDAPASPRRKRTQAAVYTITDALIRLIAPILPHTADEAWRSLRGDSACVHLELFPQAAKVKPDDAWRTVMDQRDEWLKTIEDERQRLQIDNPLDCGLTIPANDAVARIDRADLADLCGISRFDFGGDSAKVADLRNEPRCERSWKRDGTVKPRKLADGETALLSDRDAAAVGV